MVEKLVCMLPKRCCDGYSISGQSYSTIDGNDDSSGGGGGGGGFETIGWTSLTCKSESIAHMNEGSSGGSGLFLHARWIFS